MSSSNNNSSIPEIDKEQLYGKWWTAKKWVEGSLAWRDKLHKSAAYKSLDIPEDTEMGDINAPKTMISHNGVSPMALVALAALGLGGYYVYNQSNQPAPVQPPPVVSQPSEPLEDRDYDIRFYELQPDGTYKPITVERKPQ